MGAPPEEAKADTQPARIGILMQGLRGCRVCGFRVFDFVVVFKVWPTIPVLTSPNRNLDPLPWTHNCTAGVARACIVHLFYPYCRGHVRSSGLTV